MPESMSFTRYIGVSVICGLLFGFMDGLIHVNPLARELYAVYKPLARTSVNAPAGILIDLIYGFVMTGMFLVLFRSLPGNTGLVRGINFALVIWFFRVVMGVVGEWMTLNVPGKVHLYALLTGLGEMIVMGVLMGIAFRSLTPAQG